MDLVVEALCVVGPARRQQGVAGGLAVQPRLVDAEGCGVEPGADHRPVDAEVAAQVGDSAGAVRVDVGLVGLVGQEAPRGGWAGQPVGPPGLVKEPGLEPGGGGRGRCAAGLVPNEHGPMVARAWLERCARIGDIARLRRGDAPAAPAQPVGAGERRRVLGDADLESALAPAAAVSLEDPAEAGAPLVEAERILEMLTGEEDGAERVHGGLPWRIVPAPAGSADAGRHQGQHAIALDEPMPHHRGDVQPHNGIDRGGSAFLHSVVGWYK